jgi:hypothetical protein
VRWSIGIAASILAVSVGLLLLNNTGHNLPRLHENVVKLEPRQPIQPSLDKPIAPAKPQMDSVRSATAAIGGFAAEVRDEAVQLIPSARGLERALAAPTAQLPELPMQEMGKSMESGLEPVTSSARRAATLWANLLPMPKEEKKKS